MIEKSQEYKLKVKLYLKEQMLVDKIKEQQMVKEEIARELTFLGYKKFLIID